MEVTHTNPVSESASREPNCNKCLPSTRHISLGVRVVNTPSARPLEHSFYWEETENKQMPIG